MFSVNCVNAEGKILRRIEKAISILRDFCLMVPKDHVKLLMRRMLEL